MDMQPQVMIQQAPWCAACKKMRRKCLPDCIFGPYFPVTRPSFDYVHRVYGYSNVGKILKSLPAEQRRVAAESLAFEAEARVRDPVFGCVGYISLLQQHLAQSQIDCDIQEAEAQLSTAGYQPPPPLEQHWLQMPQLTAPPHHEQLDDLLWPTSAAYPSMPQAVPTPMPQPMSEILPIPSTPPPQDDLPLMTDAEVQEFAAKLEDILS